MKKLFLVIALIISMSSFSEKPKYEDLWTTSALGKFQNISEVRLEAKFKTDCGPWWYDHAYGTWQRTCVQGGGTIVCYDVMVCSQGSCVIVSHTCCTIFGCS